METSSRQPQNQHPDYDWNPPEPATLVESLRAFGYDLPSAIADLADNSITAAARHVWVDFHWNGSDSVIVITDDGCGMSEGALVQAMRLGSTNPLAQRSAHDLGRFGLGLKTASFSHCRLLSVRTRNAEGATCSRCWDLDHIARANDWQLRRHLPPSAEPHLSRLSGLKTGTAVLWQALDRLVHGQVTDNEKHQQSFLHRAELVRAHLAMVFHRRMTGKDAVRFFINDREVAPWDPFLLNEPATQVLPATRLTFKGAVVEIEPFVLPHHSKVSKATYAAAAGPRGWNAHQGFYVYRNRRLLVAGDWLSFGWAKDEQYKLARIRIELPNSLDQEWEIDVTKSKASPPTALKDELRRVAERTRAEAKRVYVHRGANLTPQADVARVLLWTPMAKHDKTFYRINRQHPLVTQAMDTAGNKGALQALLRLIEETVPIPHIVIENTERPDRLAGPFEHAADGQVREVMQQAFNSLMASGYQAKAAVDRLRTIWPFELFPALLETLCAEVKDD